MIVPVSVIIPCYNCAETIVRAVNSVFNQTVIPSELIIIDDCSTDFGETVRLINELTDQANKDIKMHVILKDKNNGPATSRNIGWNLASNPFIAFLDSDDIWHPQKLELHYQWMADNPQVVISAHRTAIFKDINDLGKFNCKIYGNKIKPYNLLWTNPFCTRGVMLRNELPYRFPENIYYAEDFFLWAEIACAYPHACYVLNCKLAFSFKNEFGLGGLSSNLIAMERGELIGLNSICNKMRYCFTIKYLAYFWSIMRFLRRVIISFLNNKIL